VEVPLERSDAARTAGELEQALRESERNYRLLADNSDSVVALLNTDWELVYISPAADRTLGWSLSELMTYPSAGFVHPDDLNTVVLPAFLRILGGGEDERFECRIAHKSGGFNWIELYCRRIADERGHDQLLITAHNITEYKRLLDQEQRQRELVQALLDSTGALGGTLKVNEVLERLLLNLERVIPHDRSTIMLIDGDYTRTVGCRGFSAVSVGTVMAARIEYATKHTFQTMIATRRAIILPDVRRDESWETVGIPEITRSHISAPILTHG
jgi:PAS domain S-box-containing protein